MRLIEKIDELRDWRNTVSGTVGFVPKMGALHDGHLSLVKASAHTCDHTIISIYVNPAQFAPGEDLSAYPRDLHGDIKRLETCSEKTVFCPDDLLMYPTGYSTSVSESRLSAMLEGKSRPTHFAGVTTIVAKLFNLINPTHAFFGKKDAQQLRIIQKMVTDLNYPVTIVPVDIVREPHGLALSSRNNYLSPGDRRKAGIIHQTLQAANDLMRQGERSAGTITHFIHEGISAEPLARIDYVAVSDHRTLEDITGIIDRDVLISVAVFFAHVRLIDNFEFMIGD